MLILPPLVLSLLSVQRLGVLADDCPPITWRKDRFPAGATGVVAAPAAAPTPIVARNMPAVQPGELNCRFWAKTYDDPNYYTCTKMAKVYGITVGKFFSMYPTLLPDCSNIEPNTEYCVAGCEYWCALSLESRIVRD
jgi:hypothetical protein